MFGKQWSLIKNGSKLPLQLYFITGKRLSMVKSIITDILKIMQNRNPNKAHGHDKISIRMLKILQNSLCRSLEFIFNDCLANGIFLFDWKKGSIFPVHKKNDKQHLNNYQPILLLPICSKILSQLIFNEMFGFFIKSDLISQHHSVLNLVAPASINSYQSLTKYTNHLMKVFMFVMYFSTFVRPLIKYCMTVLF